MVHWDCGHCSAAKDFLGCGRGAPSALCLRSHFLMALDILFQHWAGTLKHNFACHRRALDSEARTGCSAPSHRTLKCSLGRSHHLTWATWAEIVSGGETGHEGPSGCQDFLALVCLAPSFLGEPDVPVVSALTLQAVSLWVSSPICFYSETTTGWLLCSPWRTLMCVLVSLV